MSGNSASQPGSPDEGSPNRPRGPAQPGHLHLLDFLAHVVDDPRATAMTVVLIVSLGAVASLPLWLLWLAGIPLTIEISDPAQATAIGGSATMIAVGTLLLRGRRPRR